MMVPDHICKSRDGPRRVSELSPSLVLAWAAPCSFRATSLTFLCLRIHLRMVGFIIVLLCGQLERSRDNTQKVLSKVFARGFLGGARGKEPTCQCRILKRCRSDSWVGKIPRRRAWQPTPVCLPVESWTEGPGGLQSMGSQRARYD